MQTGNCAFKEKLTFLFTGTENGMKIIIKSWLQIVASTQATFHNPFFTASEGMPQQAGGLGPLLGWINRTGFTINHITVKSILMEWPLVGF